MRFKSGTIKKKLSLRKNEKLFFQFDRKLLIIK